jgi:hypothetical protein
MKLLLISSLYVIGLFLIPFFYKLLILQIYKLNIKIPIYKIYQNFFPFFLFFIIVIFAINKNPIFSNHRLIFISSLFLLFLLSFSKIFKVILKNYIYIKKRFKINLKLILFVITLINFILFFFDYQKNGLFSYIILLFIYFIVSGNFFKNKNS